MDELLAEVKTGKIKGTSSDRAGVGYGVRRKWRRPQDKAKGEREAMLHVLGEIAKENCLVNVMSKPLEGEQVSTVLLHGKPDEKRGNYFCGWLPWRNVVSLDLRWNRILQKQDSYLRFALNAAQDSLPTPRLKNWQQDSAGEGLWPLGCSVTGSLLHILCQCQKAIKECRRVASHGDMTPSCWLYTKVSKIGSRKQWSQGWRLKWRIPLALSLI